MVLLLAGDVRKGPKLRWRPGRIRWYGLNTGPAGLKLLLLQTQPSASLEGTQLSAECPRLRIRSRNSRVAREHPAVLPRTDRTDHLMCLA